jgi:hypothetical protein
VGLREAYDKHLTETVASLDALRWSRANDPVSLGCGATVSACHLVVSARRDGCAV